MKLYVLSLRLLSLPDTKPAMLGGPRGMEFGVECTTRLRWPIIHQVSNRRTASMDLNYLLSEAGIPSAENRVLVMRHVPTEPVFRKMLPWLAAERPEIYNAYQQSQHPHIQKQMTAAAYLVSCIGHKSREALFIGIYKLSAHRAITLEEYWDILANQELRRLGMKGWVNDQDRPSPMFWFDLDLLNMYEDWKGKLILDWPPPERSWTRRAERNRFRVKAILEESVLDRGMPSWDRLVLTWEELRNLPKTWISSLAQWRGVYFIHDATDGNGYVGSAYGDQNIYGRWTNYAASGDGGNKLLRDRKPDQFRFSILQRVSPDMALDGIIAIENSWKERLHTRLFGLNIN